MHNIQVIIPAAGAGKRFAESGYKEPKPFIKHNGFNLIEYPISNLASEKIRCIFGSWFREWYDKNGWEIEHYLDNKIKTYIIDYLTDGAATTCNLLRKELNLEKPLLIVNSDNYIENRYKIDLDLQEYAHFNNLDGVIVTFDKAQGNQWSFVKTNNDGLVLEVAEKRPISDIATAGFYYYHKARYFFDAYDQMVANNDRINNEFYVAPTYNYMIKANMRVGIYEIGNSFRSLGTPEDLNKIKDF